MIRLYVDGSTTPISQAEAADGTFSISLAGLSPGNHALTATAQAAGENESAPTSPRTFAGPPAPVVVVPPPVVIPPPPVTTPPPAATGQWFPVALPGLSMDANFSKANPGNAFGVQCLELDPARPGEMYMTCDYQGVWKSIDFGQTWKKINTGAGGANIDAGRPAFLVVDPNPKRDPTTPPVMYIAPLYSPAPGIYVSRDGGTSFPEKLTLPFFADGLLNGQDPYAMDIDPYDSLHLILSFHGTSELCESIDGGKTWRIVVTTAAMGSSFGIFFVDTGAASTRGNWIAISQWGNNTNGAWHTPDAGSTWKQVGTWEHFHGANQLSCAGNGVAYVSATGGVYKTTDGGATWANINGGNGNGVVLTPKNLYTSFGWATSGTWSPQLAHASRATDTKWTSDTAPAAMINGSKRGVSVFDGTNHVVLTANGNGGLWRLVEA